MNSVLTKHCLITKLLQNQSCRTIKQDLTRISSKAEPRTDTASSRHRYNKHLNKFTENKFKVNDRDIKFSQLLASNRSDPDNFGTLSDDWKMHQKLKDMPEEKGDVLETEFLNNQEGKRRLTTNQYARIIKKFLVQKKIGHAIDVFETRMKEDGAPPESYICNLLITACGEVGYVQKAFKLYRVMRSRQLKITGHTYTGLFNALANSPFSEEALGRAHHLRAALQEKGVLMNQIIYHAMIKAYGRCGDLDTAFMLVDEMLEKKIYVTCETFNFLLQACITDKNAGFRHALMVWWKMKQKRVWPDLFTFNLLLRSCRDCGLGDEAATWQVTQVILQYSQRDKTKISSEQSSNDNQSLTVPNSSEDLPNLICRQPTLGNVVAVKHIKKPEHRLLLMGGSQGVLEQMSLHNVMPDIKTFAHLLDQIPSTLTAEQDLLNAMSHAKVKVDLDFCNMLIRKRCLRQDYDSAKEVLKMIQAENFRPSIVTFGVLAMTCQTVTTAQQLLQDIQNVGFRPNVEILGALLKSACFSRDCDFVMEIMKTIEAEGIKPSYKLFRILHNFYIFASELLKKQETDDTRRLKRGRFEVYTKYFQSWRKNMNLEEEPHPWNQFKEFSSEPEDIALKNQGKMKYAP